MSIEEAIRITADTSDADKAIAKTNEKLEGLGKTGDKVTKQSEKSGKAIKDAWGSSKLGKSMNGIIGKAKSMNTMLGASGKMAMAGSVGMLALGAAVVGTAVGFKKLADGVAAMADDLGKASQRMGVSIEFYQKMGSAAGHAGTSMTTMEAGMRTMLRTMTQVDEGSKRAIESFNELGVSALDNEGNMRNQEDVFKDTLIALSKMENATERNALAQKVLGRSASELAPLFNEGADAVRNYFDANESAVVVTKELAASSARYNDAMQTLGESFKKGKTEAMEPFMKMMAELAESFDPSTIESYGQTVGTVFGWILKTGAALMVGFNGFIYAITGSMDVLVTATMGAMGLVHEAVTSTIHTIDGVIQAFVTGSLATLGSIAGFFGAADFSKEMKTAAAFSEQAQIDEQLAHDKKMANMKERHKTANDANKKTMADNLLAATTRQTALTDYISGKKEEKELTEEIAAIDSKGTNNQNATTKGDKSSGVTDPTDASAGTTALKMQNAILTERNESRLALMEEGKQKTLAKLQEDERQLAAAKAIYIKENGTITDTAIIETWDNRQALIDVKKEELKVVAREGAGSTMAALFGLDPDVPISEQAGALVSGIISQVSQLASAAGDIMSSIFDKRNTERDNEMNALKKYHKAELDNFKGSGRQKIVLERKQKEAEQKLAKEAFDKEKKQKKAQIHMSMAMGIMGAWSSAMMLPFPANVIAGGVTSALITGVSIAQLSALNAQEFQFANGGFVPGNSRTGDKITAGLNSDEVVLNTSQQKNFMAVANGQTSLIDEKPSLMTPSARAQSFSINVENLSGSDDDLQKLEDKIVELQSSGRLEIY